MLGRAVYRIKLAGFASLYLSSLALGKDKNDTDDGDDKPASTATLPNIYLDLRTNYATIPADMLSIGCSSPSLSTALAAQTLPKLTLSSPASQSVSVDVPFTVDVSDRVSLYGGFTGGASDWSMSAVSSWNVGLQADIYQQNGGSIPTMTLQSTYTRSVPDFPLATTSFNDILEFDYALNNDETRGLLAGVQHTRVEVDSPRARVHPNIIGYVGGYYQWDNNWKFTGRVGVQSFGGAQLLKTPFQPFTQPIVRLDLDRMDDNDNCLFGVTAEIAWAPNPVYLLTTRTPLYAIRN
jgi:hypothetical protein